MPARPRPTVRLRRLAGILRRLRAEKGLSREDVLEATGINKATLSRIENIKVRPQARTLATLLDLYGVEPDERKVLMQLLKDSSQSGWWQAYTDELPPVYESFIEFEDEASSVWNYESLFVPGLLQTEDYVRALVRGVLPGADREEVDQRVEVRLKRQAVLSRDQPLRFWAICDEAALHRVVGSSTIMRDQLLHLLSAMDRPTITFQVVPYDAGSHPGMPGSFMVLRFDDNPSVIYVDSMAGDLFIEDEADVHRYSNTYEYLRAVALSPDATMQLLTRTAATYERGGTGDG